MRIPSLGKSEQPQGLCRIETEVMGVLELYKMEWEKLWGEKIPSPGQFFFSLEVIDASRFGMRISSSVLGNSLRS